MLKPDQTDKNYGDQMKKFKEDNSDWGEDHTKVDIMKSRGVAQPPALQERR